MAKPLLTLTCPKCRALVEVRREDLGTQGACEVCGAKINFPRYKDILERRQQAQLACPACGKRFRPAAPTNEPALACPACGKAVPNSAAARNGSEADYTTARRGDPFWTDAWQALWRPYRDLGGTASFLLGIPVLLVLIVVAARYTVHLESLLEDPMLLPYVPGIAAGVSLFAGLCVLAPLASLLMAFVKSVGQGNLDPPNVGSALHSRNLMKLLAWSGVFLAPALLTAYRSGRSAGTGWPMAPPGAIVLLAVFWAIGPMGLLLASVGGAGSGLKVVAAVRNIAAVPARYSYLLLVVSCSAAVHWIVAAKLFGPGIEALLREPAEYTVALPLLAGGAFALLMPLVSSAYAMGLLMLHDGSKLPVLESPKQAEASAPLANLAALVTLALLFHVLHMGLAGSIGWDRAELAREKLATLSTRLGAAAGESYPYALEDFRELAQELDAPGLPDPEARYGYRALEPGDPGSFLWVYERLPVRPDRRVLVLRHDKGVRALEPAVRDRLIALQKAWREEEDPIKRRLIENDLARLWAHAGRAG